MVVELPDLRFFEWLLGPEWYQGAFFRWPVVLAAFCLATLLIGLLIVALRARWGSVARITGRVVAAVLIAALGILLLVLLWYLDPGEARFPAADGQTLEGPVRHYLGSAAAPVAGVLARLLGTGWYQGAFFYWLMLLVTMTAAILVVGWLIATMRSGPRAGVRKTDAVLAAAVADLLLISPRRVWALSRLAVTESIRRWVVVVFAVFILLLLFAGWFLDPEGDQPARLYLGFVLTATSYLVLLLALFLSSLSLPGDIKNKTLHTVVTKPVRQSEIVLGRMLGFAVVGTLLLLVMGGISYAFVIRGLRHSHQLEPADVARAEKVWAGQFNSGESPSPAKLGTILSGNHQHEVGITPDTKAAGPVRPKAGWKSRGRVKTSMDQGHWHEVSYEISAKQPGNGSSQQPGKPVEVEALVDFGPPQGRPVARVPVYGKIRFKDRTGNDAEKGINVGDEWTYRSFIEGGTQAAAIWTFEGITEERFPRDRFPNGLPVEMTIEIFRTYMGDTSKEEDIPGIPGSLSLRNPTTGQKVAAVPVFTAKDNTTDVQYIPREFTTSDGRKLDLFKDLADKGRMEIWLRCIDRAQYFGVAQADLYLRARDASFTLNFIKGYMGIWFQMVLLIGIGVMFSTFLSGPIAMLATLGAMLGGLFSDFMSRLARGEVVGGGPFEAFYRLITQQNLVSEMESGMRTSVLKMLDNVSEAGLWVASVTLPGFGQFGFANYVAYGFDVSGDVMCRCALRAAAFLLPLFLAGYVFLKTREVAK